MTFVNSQSKVVFVIALVVTLIYPYISLITFWFLWPYIAELAKQRWNGIPRKTFYALSLPVSINIVFVGAAINFLLFPPHSGSGAFFDPLYTVVAINWLGSAAIFVILTLVAFFHAESRKWWLYHIGGIALYALPPVLALIWR